MVTLFVRQRVVSLPSDLRAAREAKWSRGRGRAVISDLAWMYVLRTPRCREFLTVYVYFLCFLDVFLHPIVSASRKRGCDGVGREAGVLELVGFRRSHTVVCGGACICSCWLSWVYESAISERIEAQTGGESDVPAKRREYYLFSTKISRRGCRARFAYTDQAFYRD